ncbi:MAG TPA: rhomboid family intramembrane serine protease [Kofleriaceae bacterium]|nr:rhomboid family intramembrane serine protease [Kofleriaceae bacterium]
MRKPPPLSHFVRYPVTAGVAIIAIAVTIMTKTGRSLDAIDMNVLAFEGQPWRILTCAFPHGDLLHILFNLLWLWTFGTMLEQVWGPVRTFAIFVLFQVGSTLAEYALFSGGIGLSGIGYGLFGLLVVLARRDRRFVDAMDRRTIAIFAGWFVLCIVLTFTHVMNVGNVAHGMGAVLGVLLGFVLSARRAATRIASGAATAVLLVGSFAGATIYRPYVNLSAEGGLDSARLGYDLLGTGDDAEAVRHLRRALEISPNDAESWHNLGVGLERLGDDLGTIAAFRHALELEATPENQAALALALVDHAFKLAKAHDHGGALPFYREAVELEPSDKIAWYDLSLACTKTRDRGCALDAARHAYALDHQADYRDQLVDTLEADGDAAVSSNNDTLAIDRYREALSLGESTQIELKLSAAYRQAGRDKEADDAANKAAAGGPR